MCVDNSFVFYFVFSCIVFSMFLFLFNQGLIDILFLVSAAMIDVLE